MASKAIKGITIEIDGNTSKFQKSLSDANKSIKETQTALKEVNKALKLDPKSTELLKQKQELLKRSVDEVSRRLDIEKQGLEELKKHDKTPEVTKQMEILERQIAADAAELKNAQKELKNFGSVGKQHAKAVNEEFIKTGKKIEEVGGKIKGAGDSLTKNLTVPIVAAGTASLAAFSEVDKGYDIVIEKTGAAGEAAQEMYDIVDSLATSIPTTFDVAGEAVGEVNTRFGLTGEALEDLSEQFIKFAKLNGTDVTGSVDSVQKALSAFGLSVEHASPLLDRLTKTSQETGVSVDTLTSGLIQNGTAFQELGLNIDQSVIMMGELEKSGANGETVMQGLRKALKNAAKDGKPLNKALEDLQDTIENGKDGMDGLTAAYELFGKSGDQIYGAVKNGSLDFRNLGEEASDAAGTVSNTFETTLSPMDQWKMTLNELKLAAADVGSVVGEVLQPILVKIGEVVRGLKERWEELSPQTQEMIVKAAGIAAVIGPIVAIIGSIVTGIGSLIAALGIIGGVLGVAASTVGIVIAALTAMGVVIGYCIMHWDEIKAKIKEATESIAAKVSEMKEEAAAKFEEMKQALAQKIESIKTDIQEKWARIKEDAVTKVTDMKNDVVNKIVELRSSVESKMNDIKEKFKQKLEDIKGFFTGLKLEIPKPKMPELPHFSVNWKNASFLGHDFAYPDIDVNWYAKAMKQPYLLTAPTVMQTPYGVIGGGEAGKELMYGHESLMSDIDAVTSAHNDSLINGMYSAMSEALKEADLRIQIGNREFGRILREAGVK